MRNKYITIRQEERRNYEKDIVDKCKDQPKLFYRYVNGKLKNKSEITKLKTNNEVYDDAQEMAEVMNNCFQQVFTTENYFHSQQSIDADEVGFGVVEVAVEVRKLMEEQDVSKAIGLDRI